jgi:MFS family permease
VIVVPRPTGRRGGGRVWQLLRACPAPVRLNLSSMVLFNVGFYLVVPFLALHLAGDLRLAGWAVGLVLGVRIASQQGLFFVGGLLADRFGNRPMILTGIALRVLSLVALGVAGNLAVLVATVVFFGAAAALFAPAVESANAAYGRQLEDSGVMLRTELFGLEQMSSRLGTVLGPALGVLLIGLPFWWTTTVAAVLFAALGLAFARLLPPGPVTPPTHPEPAPAWRAVLGNRTFLAFAALCSVQLAAQNLLYLMLPEELARVSADGLVGWFYVGAALLVVLGQSTVASAARRLGHRRAVIAGVMALAAAFVVPALVVLARPAATGLLIAGLVVWVAGLQVAQMLMGPPMRDTVAVLAGERHLASHFGMLNTLGGAAALMTSLLAGALYDAAPGRGATTTATPWLVMALGIAVVAVALVTWRRWATPPRRPASR